MATKPEQPHEHKFRSSSGRPVDRVAERKPPDAEHAQGRLPNPVEKNNSVPSGVRAAAPGVTNSPMDEPSYTKMLRDKPPDIGNEGPGYGMEARGKGQERQADGSVKIVAGEPENKYTNPHERRMPSKVAEEEEREKREASTVRGPLEKSSPDHYEDQNVEVDMIKRDIGGVSTDIGKRGGGSHQRHVHLIALDNSKQSREAFHWANKNLPKQDKFVLFNALRHVPYVEGPLASVDWEARDRILDNMRKERGGMFERFKTECRKANRECVIMAPEEEFTSATRLGREICSTAQDLQAKSVVCGSRGLSGVTSYMMGSVSSKIVNTCDCSVVVVRPKDQKHHK